VAGTTGATERAEMDWVALPAFGAVRLDRATHAPSVLLPATAQPTPVPQRPRSLTPEAAFQTPPPRPRLHHDALYTAALSEASRRLEEARKTSTGGMASATASPRDGRPPGATMPLPHASELSLGALLRPGGAVAMASEAAVSWRAAALRDI